MRGLVVVRGARARSAVVMAMLIAVTPLISAQEVVGNGTVSGTVVRAGTTLPVARATVIVFGTGRGSTTDSEGNYVLRLPPGTYTLSVGGAGLAIVEREISVTAGEELTADFELAELAPQFGEEIVVIGSRTQRTALETPVPVDVLIGEEIQQTGMVETSRIIQFLAPSFNHSTSTISDGTDIVRPSTLRGLGPDQTLVLVNGRRRHPSALVHVNGSVGRGTAGVDLNAIPASAIDRIEVLRDGAAAQYGSDAIAGVINVILKPDPDVTSVSVSAGQHYESDGEILQVGVSRGFRISDRGFLNLAGEYRYRGATNRAGLDPRQQYPTLLDGSPDPREATFDRLNHRYGDAESRNGYGWLNGALPTSDEGDLYFFGGLSIRDGESGGFYRRALDGRTVPEIHPDGFLPLINTNVDDAAGSAGWRGLLGDWALDLGAGLGRNAFEFVITNSNNVSLGSASPTTARAGKLNFRQATVNLDAFRVVEWGLPNAVSLAVGGEVRNDSYQIEAGETASWIDGGVPDQYGGRAAPGIQVFPGFRPANEVDATRTNVGLYADVETYFGNLLLGVAGRFENYSDFGSNISGKLAMRYELSESAALRGSASTGFRAPSLHQAFFNNTSTQFVFSETTGELVPFEVGTFRNDSGVVRGFGVPELQEETSVHASLGFTARPSAALSISADVFRVDIDDRIVVSGQFQAETDADGNPVDGPVRQVLAPFNANAAQFFLNAVDTRTHGADVVVSWFRALGAGESLSLTAAAHWNDTEVVGEVATPAGLAGLGETLFNRIERERIESAQPRQLYNVAARYRRGEFGALVRFNYFGEVKTVESASNPANDMISSGKWLTDIDVSYRLPSGVRIAVGANNVFDVFPDPNLPAISFNGIFPFPRRTAPFGFNGGSYYTRLSYDF